jgi:acyl carrier protein
MSRLRSVMKKASNENVDWDAVKEEDTIESLGFDSLTILDLIYDIQQKFSLQFEAETLVGVKTVGELADFLQDRGV